MPRVARVDAPGAIHHVMVRGIERRSIFVDDADRHDLAARLSQIAPACGATCLAWAFMPNHVHLVVRTGVEPVSRLMARVGTGYARRFNERHDRVGHLFQNRFRSRIVGDDADLLCVIRYVHRNPLVAGIVADPGELAMHPWTGHGGLLGTIEPQPFHAVHDALGVFGATTRDARAQLRSVMKAESEDARIEFWRADASRQRDAEDRELTRAAAAICRHFRIEMTALRSSVRDRDVARARVAFAVRATQAPGLSLTRIASWLGVSKGALSRAVARDRCLADVPQSQESNESGTSPKQRGRGQQ